MIDRIDTSDENLLRKKYIALRKPCIITSLPADLTCLSQCTDLTFLAQHAGQASVAVEPISNKGTFGTAETKQKLLFSEFLELLTSDEKVYLTTQYSGEEDSAILSEPLSTLHSHLEFPITPDIAGQLVPAKINIWLGASATGTTSGLHHDFHDNFYILLSGEKRFRIFKPGFKSCEKLKVYGKPHEIFRNGLISYNGTLCSDGLTLPSKAQLRVDICEKRLAIAQQNGHDIQSAEEAYEAAMEQLLNSKLQDADEEEDGDFDAPEDYENEVGGYEDSVEEESEKQEFHGVQNLPEFHEATVRNRSGSIETSVEESSTFEEEPPSFSGMSSEEVKEMLSDDSLESSEFVLHKGEILYLPASYFHEVISLSGTQKFHMAINYWLYPPDGDNGDYLDADVMQELRSRLSTKYPSVFKNDSESKRRKLEK